MFFFRRYRRGEKAIAFLPRQLFSLLPQEKKPIFRLTQVPVRIVQAVRAKRGLAGKGADGGWKATEDPGYQIEIIDEETGVSTGRFMYVVESFLRKIRLKRKKQT